MKNYILIEHDPFFIVQRLKEIDSSYFVLFNLRQNRYEVHSSAQIGGSYCFSVKDNALDERTIFYALRTRKDKIDKVIKEIDEQNEKLQKSSIHSAVDKIMEGII